LDYKLEAQIMDNLVTKLGCTVVVIAHRLHTLDLCNRIYSMSPS